MLILYGLVAGLLVGLASGGRISRLAALDLRWAPLAVLGFLVQAFLFSGLVQPPAGIGPPVYVASTLLVLAFLIRNIRLPGIAVVVAGALVNLAAILANGGYMPTSPAALAVAGRSEEGGYSNSVVAGRPLLEPFTDVFALPAGLPFANVFSIGDALIALGAGLVIVRAMHAPPPPGALLGQQVGADQPGR